MRSIAPVRSVRVGTLVSGTTGIITIEFKSELDSHADTCVVGKDTALEIHDYERPVRVFGYDERVGQANHCRTITAVVAYDHPTTGEVYMLVINQAILIPRMKANLLSTMQMRDNDLRVNDEPKSMVLNPTEDNHAIVVPTTGNESLRIPLALDGVISYFPTRKPTAEEYENTPLEMIIDLTADSPDWEPNTTRFQEQEAAMLDSDGLLRDDVTDWNAKRIFAALHSIPQQEPPEHELGAALEGTAFVCWPEWGTGKSISAKAKREASVRSVKALKTTKHKYAIGPTVLAKNWGIGLPTARRTLEATTQRGYRTTLHPTLSRRFRTNDRQMRYRRLGHGMFTDTLQAKTVSWFRQNKYAQVFATRFGWVRVYPMRKKSDAHEGLSLMAKRDGVPHTIVMDNSKEQTMGEFCKKAREMGTYVKQTEPRSPWQNAAEGAIREVKRGAGRKAARQRSPGKLWDHCLELEGYIRSHTALDNYELQGEVPETLLSGQTADISPFVYCGWYEWIKWWDPKASYPEPKEVLGRWLGPAIDIGPAMCAKILKDNGQVIHSSSWRILTDDEMQDPGETKLRDAFDAKVEAKIGPPISEDELKDIDPDIPTPEYDRYDDDFEGTRDQVPDIDDVTPEDEDYYIGAEVNLPFKGTMRAGKVKRRARDNEGELTGTSNSNPILDTRQYQVEFPDGDVAEYSANLIAENMFAQCDPEGNQHLLMDAIVDHKADDKAVKFADRFVIVKGKRYHRKTTVGWKLCIRWKDGSTSWERLADLKESYPVEVAEYAVAQDIDKEPAYSWWVPYVLKKRNRIIAAVNKRYHKRTHKFGFEIPKTVKRAQEIDKENGNTLWQDAIAKEMANVRVAFKILNDGEEPPPGYTHMGTHMVFEIKLDGFRRKARMVGDGHTVDAPAVMTYASVVSRETVRVALTMAALNDLEVKASDVQNAFLTAPCEEKIWTTLGPEFGLDYGKKAIIVRALYGLKSAGGSFSRHIGDCMRNMGYEPCKADPDLWYKPMIRPEDGFKYYAYLLLYVDDCLAIHHDATSALEELDKFFMMKPGSIGDPDIYLGAKLRKVQLDNGVWAWSMSPSKYVQESVRNVEEYLAANYGGRKLNKRASAPWPNRDYSPELDTTPELDEKAASYYQSQCGVLRWMIELGRIDCITEVSLLASQMALPREGHLDALFHVFAHLKQTTQLSVGTGPYLSRD